MNFMLTDFPDTEEPHGVVAVLQSPDQSMIHDHDMEETKFSAVELRELLDEVVIRMPCTKQGSKPYDGLDAMVKLPQHVRN